MPAGLCDFVWVEQKDRGGGFVCLSILKLNPGQDYMRNYMRKIGSKMCWELGHTPGTGMMLKTLLITSLLGWVRCQESQSMTSEEKTVIRCV